MAVSRPRLILKTHSVAGTTAGNAGPVRVSAELPWLSWALLLGSGIVAFGPLTPTWNFNANYSFGWWIPVVSLVLFAERWPLRPPREVAGPFLLAPRLVVGGLLFLAFRLAAEADPDWRPGLWILVGLYVVALLTWLWLEGGISWVRHFAFPVGFLFLSLPWSFEIEYPLVQGLMRWNAVLVADSLQYIDIFAQPAGNIIQLQNCKLGVEEACSGILSLQASLVMGCLLGDIYRLVLRRRVELVLASMTLALVGNYLRTLFLALMAYYSGPQAVPEWHDTAGYAILVFTAVGSWIAALDLVGGKIPDAPVVEANNPEDDRPRQTRRSLRFALAIVGIALLAETITQGWFGWREAHLTRHPEWAARFPTSSPSFTQVPFSDITLDALRCDKSEAVQWQDAQGWNWNAYWLQYEPKPYTRVVLSWHNPDQCLPSVGMTKDRDYPDFTVHVNGLDFYVHPKKFLSKDVPVYVFWLVYPNQGNLPAENYKTKGFSYASKFQSHLQDVWNGYRGVGVETLEIAIIGPKNYDEAKAGYLAGLKAIAVPGALPPKSESGTSR